MRRFIETTPEFQGEKVALADVFRALEGIERKAGAYLIDVVWHHLQRVKPMYKDTLGVEFPADMGTIFRAVHMRHDIVHRNGKTKEGAELFVSTEHVEKLVQAVQAFVQDIDTQVAEVKSKYAVKPEAADGEDAF